MTADKITQHGKFVVACAGLTPDQADLTITARLQRLCRNLGILEQWTMDGHLRQIRDTQIRIDHLYQRQKTGGGNTADFVGVFDVAG